MSHYDQPVWFIKAGLGRQRCVVLCGIGTWPLHYSNYPTVTPVSGINGSLVHSSPRWAQRIVRRDYYGHPAVCESKRAGVTWVFVLLLWCVLCTFCVTSCAFHIEDDGESFSPLLFPRLLSCLDLLCFLVCVPPSPLLLIVKEKHSSKLLIHHLKSLVWWIFKQLCVCKMRNNDCELQ